MEMNLSNTTKYNTTKVSTVAGSNPSERDTEVDLNSFNTTDI